MISKFTSSSHSRTKSLPSRVTLENENNSWKDQHVLFLPVEGQHLTNVDPTFLSNSSITSIEIETSRHKKSNIYLNNGDTTFHHCIPFTAFATKFNIAFNKVSTNEQIDLLKIFVVQLETLLNPISQENVIKIKPWKEGTNPSADGKNNARKIQNAIEKLKEVIEAYMSGKNRVEFSVADKSNFSRAFGYWISNGFVGPKFIHNDPENKRDSLGRLFMPPEIYIALKNIDQSNDPTEIIVNLNIASKYKAKQFDANLWEEADGKFYPRELLTLQLQKGDSLELRLPK